MQNRKVRIMPFTIMGQRIATVLGPAAMTVGLLAGGAGVATADEEPTGPRLLEIELDVEDSPPVLEVEFVDPQGVHQEVDIDLRTGMIIPDSVG